MLTAVGAKGWVVISKDVRIRYRDVERAAVWSARVGLFIFRGGNMTADEFAPVIAGAMEQMVRLARAQPAPFIATISKRGVVKVVES